MLGFYDYTMFLTFASLVSASIGIVISLLGLGHPFIGMFFLLFCGLCDAFDGKVARTKKNRTEIENKFGIQIDSLCDVIAFGVLPTCIGAALVVRSEIVSFWKSGDGLWFSIACYAVMALYSLAAMIRLAYFNVTEEERQKTETGARKYYMGLPVTSASLIFPFFLMIQYICQKFFHTDITYVYFIVMLAVAIAFVSKFHLKKPGMRTLLIMIGIGLAEAAIMIAALLITAS